jgi:signal transduction histidine kinase
MDLSDEALMIACDGRLVKIVFLNLMDNGCKYSADNTVHVTLKAQEGRIVVVFENHGIGVPPEEMNRIFDPFARGTNSDKIKGYGIGLSLANQIMKLHRGTIQVQSSAGPGITRFVVTFPQEPAKAKKINPVLIGT